MVAALLTPVPCSAQVAPGSPSGQPAADDTPAVKVGGTLFADYTVVQAPEITDGDGNTVVANAFNVGRAYINVTGRISHLISFRITPDIFREAGPGSSLNGSYVFRLRYGYAQFNLGQSSAAPNGTWVRLGLQQTPWVDFIEPHISLPLPGHDVRGSGRLFVLVGRWHGFPYQPAGRSR